MTWSLGEVEALARKAARGGGMSWGLAEDAGKAVRWLCARGLPGAEALSGYLVEFDRANWDDIRPRDLSGQTWTAGKGPLCPFASGTALCDVGLAQPLSCTNLSWPLLMVPFVAWAAGKEGTGHVTWPGAALSWSNGQLGAQGDALLTSHTATLSLSISGENLPPCQPETRATLSEEVRATLTRFAARTYAPETDASKLSGAGAGLVDRD